MLDKSKVQEVLDQIRPSLQADGGDVELVEVTDDDFVIVQLQGACHGCPMSQITLSNGIERILKDRIPEVQGVRSADMPEDFDMQAFLGGQPA